VTNGPAVGVDGASTSARELNDWGDGDVVLGLLDRTEWIVDGGDAAPVCVPIACS